MSTTGERQPRGVRRLMHRARPPKLHPMRQARVLVAAVALSTAAPVGIGTAAEQATRPPWTKNCTALNKKYPHGVGRAGARDKTSGDPVTNFRRSTHLYNIAMRWNKGLDPDKDGIACEKA